LGLSIMHHYYILGVHEMNKRLETTATYSPAEEGRKQTFASTLIVSMALLVGMWSSQAHAVPVTAPVVGEIEKITVNDINDHWSGGVIVAGGQNIIVPKNLLIDLPANRVTLQQLFTEASASCQTQTETGLAKGDKCNASGTGGIATIMATRNDNGHAIAGDVLIAKGAESVTGQVTYINYAQGYFRVNGKLGSAAEGAMVRLNDPDGRHTVQSGLGCAGSSASVNCSPDPRFTLDGDNYTNVFSTGYPMCIPSTAPRSFADALGLGVTTTQGLADGTGDVLCPTTNRPGPGLAVADSRRFAPILIGDSVTAEGNYEDIGGVHFLSAHSTTVSVALATSTAANQPDYMFLDEVGIDAPGFQNRRARSLFIGYSTLPPDIMIWSIHYDPKTNSPHEFPLATTAGCDTAAGPLTCTGQGLVTNAGGNIFKIRHDVDFAVTTKPRWNPCSHLQNDPRFSPLNICSSGAGGTTAEQFAILSPIPHEIQARTGRKFADMQLANPQLITLDINGNQATNGQYLFPFGIGLGGVTVPEMVEIDLNALQTPTSFSGIPWNLDRRLSPGGCLDNNNDGIGECEATVQPLTPFPFEGAAMDPRTLGGIPSVTYNDPNYVSSGLSDVSDRILSYVNPDALRPGGNAVGVNDTGNFTTAILTWNANSAAPGVGSPGGGDVSSSPTIPQAQICSANSAFNTPPVAKADTDTTPAGVAKTISVVANDSDINGDTLSVIGVSSSANTVVGVSTATSQGGIAALNIDGTITFTPAANFAGVDTFIYTLSDGKASVTGTVTMTVVASSNNPPVAAADSATVLEDGSVVINVLANDTDDNSGTGSSILSIASVSTPAKGTVTISGDAGVNKDQKVTYTPKPNANGSDTFSYVVADGQGGTDTATVTVTITAVNDAPVAVGESVTVVRGTALSINVLTNDSDIDGDALIVSLPTALPAVLPTKGTVLTNGTTVTYTANGVTGPDTFTYTISDRNVGGLTATATVTVNVIPPVVDGIAFTPPAEFRTVKKEWRVSGTGSVDGKTITLRLGTASAPVAGSNCTANPVNGCVIGTPQTVTLGIWTVRQPNGIQPNGNTQITAWSSGGGSASSGFTIRP
jgi:Bacterial Ig domain